MSVSRGKRFLLQKNVGILVWKIIPNNTNIWYNVCE